MHKTHSVSSSRCGGLCQKPHFFLLYTKLFCNAFLLTLNDVTLEASKEVRNYSSFVMVGFAEWADTVFMLFQCRLGAAQY